MKRMTHRLLLAAALSIVLLPCASIAATPLAGTAADNAHAFAAVLQKRGDVAVPVKFVMSMSGMGSERQQEGQTQGTLVSADGLILVPGRVVSLDLSMFGRSDSGISGSAPSAKSGQFRVRLAGSDEWLPADLVTRDTELGIAWLRLRHPKGKLPFVDFNDAAKVATGTQLYTVMRTSDQFGSVPIVRSGYVLGETDVPRQTWLVDGAPGAAFDGDGKPAGFVDLDLSGMMRMRSSSGGIGMDLSDMVLSMIPADRIARVTARAAVLPVVKSSDTDDSESAPDDATPTPAKKPGDADSSTKKPADDASAKEKDAAPVKK
jgi:hypothetical protein